VASFPIVIKHPDKIITIRNITNSYYVWNKPNDSHLYSKATLNNDPDFKGLSKLEKGIVRVEVEIEALKDNVAVDEMTMGSYNFSLTSKMSSGKAIVTALPFQLKSTPLNPDQFSNVLATKSLKKGGKVSGILPFEIYSAASKQNFELDIDSRDTLAFSLTIPASFGGGK